MSKAPVIYDGINARLLVTGTLLKYDGTPIGGAGGNSFTTWQPITGTSPTAVTSSDTMNLTSSDSTIGINGNSGTDTLSFILSPTIVKPMTFTNAATSGTPTNPFIINTGDPNTVGQQIIGNTTPPGTPANSTFYALYTTTINATNSGGTGTGTAVGGAAISGSVLNLVGGTLKYVTYSATGNANFTSVGSIQFKYTPNYTGSPASNRCLISIGQSGILNNLIQILHTSSGLMSVSLYDSTTGLIYDSTLAAWSPTSGQTYELELNLDCTAAAVSRFFIDGVQLGSNISSGGKTRTNAANLLYVGGSVYSNGGGASDGKISDLVIKNVVNHTANYTAPTVYGGPTTQIANLSEWYAVAAGSLLAKVDSAGKITAQNLALAAATTATSATAGAATALPANPLGYMTFNLNGTNVKVPYYSV